MEKVYQIIQANSKKTGNASGISCLKAWEASNLDLKEFSNHVAVLINQEKVIMREGINHSLLFAI